VFISFLLFDFNYQGAKVVKNIVQKNFVKTIARGIKVFDKVLRTKSIFV
jgi:hypothetical protein